MGSLDWDQIEVPSPQPNYLNRLYHWIQPEQQCCSIVARCFYRVRDPDSTFFFMDWVLAWFARLAALSIFDLFVLGCIAYRLCPWGIGLALNSLLPSCHRTNLFSHRQTMSSLTSEYLIEHAISLSSASTIFSSYQFFNHWCHELVFPNSVSLAYADCYEFLTFFSVPDFWNSSLSQPMRCINSN